MEKQASKHLGDVFLKSPPALLLASLMILILFASLAAVGFYGEYTPTYRTSGQLIKFDDGERAVELLEVDKLLYPLKNGEEVRLFYDAFPVQSYGFQFGTVLGQVRLASAPDTETFLVRPEDWVGANEPEDTAWINGMAVSIEVPGKPIKIWKWIAGSMGGTK